MTHFRPSPRHHRIRSIAVTGGAFLDGVHLDLADDLTCFIGGRGSGKTSLLELLAFAVQPPGTAVTSHVRNSLGQGTLRATVETSRGVQYTIERSVDGPCRVEDGQGRVVAAPIDQLIAVDYFRAHDIETTATDAVSQLRLIDAFASEEMHEISTLIATTERDLGENAADLARLLAIEAGKSDDAAEAAVLEEKLKGLAASGPQATNLTVANDAATLRQQERQAITSAFEALAKTRDDGGRFALAISRRFATLVDDAVLAGVNAETMGGVAAYLATARSACTRALTALEDACNVAESGIQDKERALAARHEDQDAAHRKILALVKEETSRAEERKKLQQKLALALTARRQLHQTQAERRAIEQKRRELVARGVQLRDRRFARRRQIASDISRELSPSVRITVKQNGDRDAFAGLLQDCLRNSKMQYKAMIPKLVELEPDELASYVRRTDVPGLAERAALDEEKARKVIEKLADCETVCRIETVELGDMPRIELFDGVYKDTANVSTGQRCIAILPIVLLGSERPLLIDQPEDNIDGAFLVEVIIKTIRAVKKRCQLVFASHNANVVVLSSGPEDDPDRGGLGPHRVVALASDGSSSQVLASGGVDQMKDHIQHYVEGGTDAFIERMHRYGY